MMRMIGKCFLSFSLMGLGVFDVSSNVVVAQQTGGGATLPELPRRFVDTTFLPPTGKTFNLKAGDNLQAALNAAQPGDLIVLQAGAAFRGAVTLPKKDGEKWIVIRTSSPDSALPREGTRITPANSNVMAQIVAPGQNEPALRTEAGAHHYRFIGIEFKKVDAQAVADSLVAVGDGSKKQTTLSQIPHHLIFDRVYIHGEKTSGVKHCVVLSSASTAIIDSYISECTAVGFDAQAIVGWNGPGPFKIVNNYLEGSGENVMFGGADAANADLTPSDIEFRLNHLFKPLTWKIGDPSYAGIPWAVKNLFELKNAKRLLIDGNIFENVWAHGQIGTAVVFTPRNQSNTAPWSGIQDVTFTNNVVRHATHGLGLSGRDNNYPSESSKRFLIANNVFEDIGGSQSGAGRLFQFVSGAEDVTIENNTAFHSGPTIIAEGVPNPRFVFRNNIVFHNTYGVHGTSGGAHSKFPDWVFKGNVIIGTPPSLMKQYPANNFFPATVGEVQFVNAAEGNYRLASASPYKRAGTGGKDIGADSDAIETALGKAAAKMSSAGKGAT